jgi:hypothetical protein
MESGYLKGVEGIRKIKYLYPNKDSVHVIALFEFVSVQAQLNVKKAPLIYYYTKVQRPLYNVSNKGIHESVKIQERHCETCMKPSRILDRGATQRISS